MSRFVLKPTRCVHGKEFVERCDSCVEWSNKEVDAIPGCSAIVGQFISHNTPLLYFRTIESMTLLSDELPVITCPVCGSGAVAHNDPDVAVLRGIKSAELSLKERVLQIEKGIIIEALRASNGRVSEAAHRLGYKNHQTLIHLLKHRHRDLVNERTPASIRRKPLIGARANPRRRVRSPRVSKGYEPMVYVGEDCVVPESKSFLRFFGEMPPNGHHFDLIVESDLGMAIAYRHHPQYRAVPQLLLVPERDEQVAWRAGADAVLIMPRAQAEVLPMIERLLAERTQVEAKRRAMR